MYSNKLSKGILLTKQGEILDKYGYDKAILKTLQSMMIQDNNDTDQSES